MWILKSLGSGLFGSFASVVGKLSVSPDSIFIAYLSDSCEYAFPKNLYNICDKITFGARVGAFGAMFACNSIMLSLFVQALESGNTLPVTVMNSAISFLFTGLFGVLIFNESITHKWCLGVLLIVLGIACIAISQIVPRRPIKLSA